MVSNMYASKTKEKDAEVTSEKRPSQTWMEYIGEEAYALAIYRLQNEAGLSFKEARATLLPVLMAKTLAEEWGCSRENIYNMRRKGIEKIREATGGDNKEIMRLMPLKMSHIF